MQKIVVNRCYGGFSLSHKGVMEYAKRKGIKLYPEVDEISKKYGLSVNDGSAFVHYYTVPVDKAHELIKEAEKKRNYEESNKIYFSNSDIPRDDLILVKMVEELGGESNGPVASNYSELEVVEIPDDVEWQIEEYDGNEWVSERHRTW